MAIMIELPPPVQAALEADAKAQARPVADVLAEVLTERYAAVTKQESLRQETLRADVLAWAEEAAATLPAAPDSPTRRDARESVFGEIVTEKFRKQGFNL